VVAAGTVVGPTPGAKTVIVNAPPITTRIVMVMVQVMIVMDVKPMWLITRITAVIAINHAVTKTITVQVAVASLVHLYIRTAIREILIDVRLISTRVAMTVEGAEAPIPVRPIKIVLVATVNVITDMGIVMEISAMVVSQD